MLFLTAPSHVPTSGPAHPESTPHIADKVTFLKCKSPISYNFYHLQLSSLVLVYQACCLACLSKWCDTAQAGTSRESLKPRWKRNWKRVPKSRQKAEMRPNLVWEMLWEMTLWLWETMTGRIPVGNSTQWEGDIYAVEIVPGEQRG